MIHEHLNEAYHVLCGLGNNLPINFEMAFLRSLAEKIPAVCLADNMLSSDDAVCVKDFVDTLPMVDLDMQEYHFPNPKEVVSA